MGWLNEYLADKRRFRNAEKLREYERQQEIEREKRAEDREIAGEKRKTKAQIEAEKRAEERRKEQEGQDFVDANSLRTLEKEEKEADEVKKSSKVISAANKYLKVNKAAQEALGLESVDDELLAQRILDYADKHISNITSLSKTKREKEIDINSRIEQNLAELGLENTPENRALIAKAGFSKLSAIPKDIEQEQEFRNTRNIMSRLQSMPDNAAILGTDNVMRLTSTGEVNQFGDRVYPKRFETGAIDFNKPKEPERIPVPIKTAAPVNPISIPFKSPTWTEKNNKIQTTPREVNVQAPIATQTIGEDIGVIPAIGKGLAEAFSTKDFNMETAPDDERLVHAATGVMPYQAASQIQNALAYLLGTSRATPYTPDPNANLTQRRLNYLKQLRRQ